MSRISAGLDKPVFEPASSVFVSANAGAGKTNLLVKRVLSLLLHGVSPSKILCITFTKAAAAEMSARILKELGEWVMASDETLRSEIAPLLKYDPDEKLLLRARSLFAQVLEAASPMRIETIHGFCQSVLKRFPLEAGISPHFQVIEERDEKEMLQEAKLQLFNLASEGNSKLQESLRVFARELGEQTFQDILEEIISNKRKFYMLFAQPGGIDALIGDLGRALDIGGKTTPETLIAEHFNYNLETLDELRRIADILLQGKGKADQETGKGLADWLSQPEQRMAMIPGYKKVFITDKNTQRETLFTKNTLVDAGQIQKLLEEQNRVANFHDCLQSWYIVRLTAHVLIVAQKLLAIYNDIKLSHAQMDYDDLIVTACDLLERSGMAPWVLYKLDGGIDHVLVDEAQDTSPEQWRIIMALTEEFFAGEGRSENERSLFVVGDEKQSIFSFQGANVSALQKMYAYFKERIEDAGKPFLPAALIHSFRSTREILGAVDTVFMQPAARQGLMAGDGKLEHIPTIERKGVVELWPLVELNEDIKSPASYLAHTIAGSIQQWIEKDGVMPADILILVRKRKFIVDRLVRALKRRGIPVAGVDRMVLGDNLAVQDLIALGQCLLLPEDDLTLAALLKSPIFNLSEENLFTLAWNRGDKTLWDRLKEKGGDAYDLLADLRAKADFISPYELYAYVLDTLGARRRIIGRMGEEYADPIDEFMNQIMLYEKNHIPSLQGFLHWLTISESKIKRDMEQAKDAVRIMTVHGSKGLQAPIVILPDTTSLPDEQDKMIWMDDEYALPIWPRSQKHDNAKSKALRDRRKEASMAEYRRLLYVALTRAQDRLYVCGAVGKKGAGKGCWYDLVKDGLQGMATACETPLGEGLRVGQALPDPIKRKSAVASRKHDASVLAFLTKPLPVEPTPTKPLTPSRMSGEEPPKVSPLSSQMYERGLLIHKLLQYLPGIAVSDRARVATQIANAFQHTLSDAERKACIKEAIAVMNDPSCTFLFAEGSLAEVPVVGNAKLASQIVSVAGQIDRLAIGEKEVWIADFKSNQHIPEETKDISRLYLRQLGLYKRLLEQIYPQKTIRCALVWTTGPKVSVIDDSLLDEAVLSSYI